MQTLRKAKVSLNATLYYHFIHAVCDERFGVGSMSRPGVHSNIGEEGLRIRLLTLGQIFAIDVAAYAVISNWLKRLHLAG